MAIQSFQGDVPSKCNICFDLESNKELLVQTTCDTNAIGTEIIPNAYHRECLKQWALQGTSFTCPLCRKALDKRYLLSNRERLFHSQELKTILKTTKVLIERATPSIVPYLLAFSLSGGRASSLGEGTTLLATAMLLGGLAGATNFVAKTEYLNYNKDTLIFLGTLLNVCSVALGVIGMRPILEVLIVGSELHHFAKVAKIAGPIMGHCSMLACIQAGETLLKISQKVINYIN